MFGVLATAVSLIGIGTPSLWGDEAASVLSSQRSLPSLFRMLGNIDAVHGVYYLFLHVWILVFGASDASVRVPSALAMGVVAAGIFVLARHLSRPRVAVIAALVTAVLPRLFSNGGEARSYSASTALAVWLTILLVYLLDRGLTGWLAWLGYALAVAFGVYLFLYLALLIPVHAVYLFGRRRSPGMRRRFVPAVAVVVVLASPIISLGYAEREQIAFLRDRNYATPEYIVVTQWFGDPRFATIAWCLIVVAAITTVRSLVRGRSSAVPAVDRLAPLAFVWLVLPTLALLAINLVTPSYNLRYLALSAPAAALVIALGIDALRLRVLIVVATVATLALAAPSDIGDRGPFANDHGSDWRPTSQWIGTHSTRGDAVVFDDSVRPSRRPRLALRTYPAGFEGLKDVELVTPYYDTAGLWDQTAALDTVTAKLSGVERVLLVELEGSPDEVNKVDLATLQGLGYTLRDRHVVYRTVVYTLTRGTP